MSDSPKSLYIVGGEEYGIKDKYIKKLTEYYGNKEEYRTVSELINFLSVRHLIPIPPTLYLVRYDESFVTSINAQMAQKLKNLKVNWTIFCIYIDPKHIAKIDKFLPDNTCSIESVNPKFVNRYLHSDFPKLDDRSIKIATECAVSYGHARTICESMSHANPSTLARMTEGALAKLFGCSDPASEKDVRKAVANRNFNSALSLLESYEGNLDNLIYVILQTMIDMEKILTSKYSDLDIKDSAKYWKIEDVYHMFMNTYEELSKLRSNTSTDIKSSLIYLFGLFTFKNIPSVEDMKSEL